MFFFQVQRSVTISQQQLGSTGLSLRVHHVIIRSIYLLYIYHHYMYRLYIHHLSIYHPDKYRTDKYREEHSLQTDTIFFTFVRRSFTVLFFSTFVRRSFTEEGRRTEDRHWRRVYVLGVHWYVKLNVRSGQSCIIVTSKFSVRGNGQLS